jgi:muramoyltetrapeptide carboxypeptidase LdcA involved in peptidoglycan recycling
MEFTLPPRLEPGDKVAVISPCAGLPSIFPWVYELGLKRLREVFYLEPVEFPSAKKSLDYLEKHPQARADDIHAAFLDPSIKAVIATIGGNDQMRLLPYLDKHILAKHPKIFLGYSDNTSLHLFLWNLGIISYYGGNLMVQFAMQGSMHDYTINYLKKALFHKSIGVIEEPSEWTDYDLPWEDPDHLKTTRPLYKNEGLEWHNTSQTKAPIEGRLWGGCLECLDAHFFVRRYLPSPEKLSGCILYLETSEEMPSDGFVYRCLMSLGELGLLQKFKGFLMGRPKAQFCNFLPSEGRDAFIKNQKSAVKKALEHYDCTFPVIFDLPFGHTDPQVIIPNGGLISIDCKQKTLQLL